MTNPQGHISSAKSWLCFNDVDRESQILPWNSTIPNKLSPVEVSRLILEYLSNQFEISESQPDCKIVVTVPASFDETARNLTLKACQDAGLKNVSLLEEPLAALYHWISKQGDRVFDTLQPGNLVLVCDVGGGTSDFSLVAINEEEGQLKMERIAVGPHLLLGGDNIDLTIAYHARAQLEAEGQSLDEWQFRSLIYQSQIAKEKLLNGSQNPTVFPSHQQEAIFLLLPLALKYLVTGWYRLSWMDSFHCLHCRILSKSKINLFQTLAYHMPKIRRLVSICPIF